MRVNLETRPGGTFGQRAILLRNVDNLRRIQGVAPIQRWTPSILRKIANETKVRLSLSCTRAKSTR